MQSDISLHKSTATNFAYVQLMYILECMLKDHFTWWVTSIYKWIYTCVRVCVWERERARERERETIMDIPIPLTSKRFNFDRAVGSFHLSCLYLRYMSSSSFWKRRWYFHESNLELIACEIVLLYLLCCQNFNGILVFPGLRFVRDSSLFCFVLFCFVSSSAFFGVAKCANHPVIATVISDIGAV